MTMPLYEYVCNDCDARFDTLVASHERADDVACTSCSGSNTRRLVSTFAFSGADSLDMKPSTSTRQGGCCGGSCGCHHG